MQQTCCFQISSRAWPRWAVYKMYTAEMLGSNQLYGLTKMCRRQAVYSRNARERAYDAYFEFGKSSHLQPLAPSSPAATCSHLQPLGPIPTSSFSPENLQHSPVDGTGEFSTFSGGSKWLQVAASVCWEQVAASGCKWLLEWLLKWLLKWLQVAAVAASGCWEQMAASGKWLLKWLLQVAASGCKGAFWKQISAILRPLGRLLNFSSGIIGKRPFLAKSWPGAFWKQISTIWWLLGASGCKWLQVAARGLQVAASGCKWLLGANGCKWLQVGASGCRKTPENFQHSPVGASGCKWLPGASGYNSRTRS